MHPKQPLTPSASVVSYDFGFVSWLPEEMDKLTALFVHDQHTKMMHGVRTEQKAGKIFLHMNTDLTRFLVHPGHQSVVPRSPFGQWPFDKSRGSHRQKGSPWTWHQCQS